MQVEVTVKGLVEIPKDDLERVQSLDDTAKVRMLMSSGTGIKATVKAAGKKES